jgi:hypothetical protein
MLEIYKKIMFRNLSFGLEKKKYIYIYMYVYIIYIYIYVFFGIGLESSIFCKSNARGGVSLFSEGLIHEKTTF